MKEYGGYVCDKKRVIDPCVGAVSVVACGLCPRPRVYVRCLLHGGESGAQRSLKSHIGLTHPNTDGVTVGGAR